jgi:hypothetical protein
MLDIDPQHHTGIDIRKTAPFLEFSAASRTKLLAFWCEYYYTDESLN